MPRIARQRRAGGVGGSATRVASVSSATATASLSVVFSRSSQAATLMPPSVRSASSRGAKAGRSTVGSASEGSDDSTVRRIPAPIVASVMPGLGGGRPVSGDVADRAAFRDRLGLAQDLVRDGGDVALAHQDVAGQVPDRIALAPLEVGVR